jgi:TolB-like protein
VGAPAELKRRLSAVAFADIAGFSRLMAANPEQTVRHWKFLRDEVLNPRTVEFGGKVAEIAGDAVLVEFESAVQAVRWALDVQAQVRSLSPGSQDGTVRLRIGINVEDVIDDDGVLLGDGVNIASRIHQVAEPGQVVVTSVVRDYVGNRLPIRFRDLGTPPLKNISRTVQVFLIEPDDSQGAAVARSTPIQWSSRPTVAVMPFRTIGSEEEDAYFGEGITEDIIVGISRSRSMHVIARNSTLRYRDRSKGIGDIARELDVRYMLDGSVRRLGNKLRISAELIEVSGSRALWAQRFDGDCSDLFAFQDRISASIVSALEPRVSAAEALRIRDRPTDSLDAYDCLLKAMSQFYLFTPESIRNAEVLIERALRLDNSYAQAHTYLAWWLNFSLGDGRSRDPASDTRRAIEASQRAVLLDPEDAFGLSVAGHVLSFMQRRTDDAMDLFDQALRINDSSPYAWGLSALTLAYRGEAEEALERLRNVWRLDPFDPLNFYFFIVAGIAEFVAGRYSESIAWLRRSRRANPRFAASVRMLTAAMALAGDREGASEVAADMLSLDPAFNVGKFVAWYPLARRRDLELLAEGLRAAGLPG